MIFGCFSSAYGRNWDKLLDISTDGSFLLNRCSDFRMFRPPSLIAVKWYSVFLLAGFLNRFGNSSTLIDFPHSFYSSSLLEVVRDEKVNRCSERFMNTFSWNIGMNNKLFLKKCLLFYWSSYKFFFCIIRTFYNTRFSTTVNCFYFVINRNLPCFFKVMFLVNIWSLVWWYPKAGPYFFKESEKFFQVYES